MTIPKPCWGRRRTSRRLRQPRPASAQYYDGYSQPTYRYAQSYGDRSPTATTSPTAIPSLWQPFGYAQPYAANTGMATQQCTAAVQNRLANRASIGSIIGCAARRQYDRPGGRDHPGSAAQQRHDASSWSRQQRPLRDEQLWPLRPGRLRRARIRLSEHRRSLVPLRRRLSRICAQRQHQSPLTDQRFAREERRVSGAPFFAGSLAGAALDVPGLQHIPLGIALRLLLRSEPCQIEVIDELHARTCPPGPSGRCREPARRR